MASSHSEPRRMSLGQCAARKPVCSLRNESIVVMKKRNNSTTKLTASIWSMNGKIHVLKRITAGKMGSDQARRQHRRERA